MIYLSSYRDCAPILRVRRDMVGAIEGGEVVKVSSSEDRRRIRKPTAIFGGVGEKLAGCE